MVHDRPSHTAAKKKMGESNTLKYVKTGRFEVLGLSSEQDAQALPPIPFRRTGVCVCMCLFHQSIRNSRCMERGFPVVLSSIGHPFPNRHPRSCLTLRFSLSCPDSRNNSNLNDSRNNNNNNCKNCQARQGQERKTIQQQQKGFQVCLLQAEEGSRRRKALDGRVATRLRSHS